MRRAFLLLAACVLTAAGQDTPRHAVETIRSARHEFTVRMGGTVDGENTRDPIVYSAWKQAFEPMRSVRLENAGDTDVVNPWVLVNGKRNWRSAKDIAEGALRSFGDPRSMTDAEKARAIWEFQRRHRFHATTGDFEVRDPVKMYNAYGFSLCGDNAPVLADLWREAGLRTRRGFPIGHCVPEVWYEGGWHMLDADESVVFLRRDNQTIAAEKEVAHDHDLAKRGYPDDMLGALYTYDGGHGGAYPSHTGHTMAFTLRPGEALEWRWSNSGKHHHAPPPTLYTLRSTLLSEWGPQASARLANGRWIYTPRLRKGEAAQWKMETPYPIVGGHIRARARGAMAIAISHDGRAWTEVARASAPGDFEANLDPQFPNDGPAAYRYFVRAEPEGALESITIENDLQMAPLSLPALELGDNRITYTDETTGARDVRVTFDWVERSSWLPPAAPASPRTPADAAQVEGTKVAFEWAAAQAPAGGSIAAYQFQLADDASFRWALTPDFDAVVDQPRFALRRDGLLNPGRRYYWRVRARTADGVWGPWSRAWTFVPQGPGVPLNVRLEASDPDAFTLRWDANEAGRKPVSYRVYASDEKGFSAEDQPYSAPAGNQDKRGLFPGRKTVEFPGNLLATVSEPAFRVRPRHAFYRVVAVDEHGNRSGSSEYASAPRPFIWSEAPTEGKVGTPFRYEAKTIASIGDLTYRDFGPEQAYQSAYWDADRPVFSFETELPRCGTFDPKWLRIDAATGVLSGTPGPGDAGEYQVNVKVDIPGAGRYIQSFPLRIRP